MVSTPCGQSLAGGANPEVQGLEFFFAAERPFGMN